jgi:hypothetical protein
MKNENFISHVRLQWVLNLPGVCCVRSRTAENGPKLLEESHHDCTIFPFAIRTHKKLSHSRDIRETVRHVLTTTMKKSKKKKSYFNILPACLLNYFYHPEKKNRMFSDGWNISFYNLHNTKGRSLIAGRGPRTMIRRAGESNNVNIFEIIEISEV